jgi:hypothetical protein
VGLLAVADYPEIQPAADSDSFVSADGLAMLTA